MKGLTGEWSMRLTYKFCSQAHYQIIIIKKTVGDPTAIYFIKT